MRQCALSGSSVLYESGVVPPGGDVTKVDDPDLWQLRDFAFDAAGNPKHMFWEIARLEESTIPAAITTNPSLPEFYATHLVRRFPKNRAASFPGIPDRVTVLVHIQPMGFDVLDDLIAFISDLHEQEQSGNPFTPEEADTLGTEAQERAEAIAGQVSQAAAQLGVTIEQ